VLELRFAHQLALRPRDEQLTAHHGQALLPVQRLQAVALREFPRDERLALWGESESVELEPQ
jgi:hypothetical protein